MTAEHAARVDEELTAAERPSVAELAGTKGVLAGQGGFDDRACLRVRLPAR